MNKLAFVRDRKTRKLTEPRELEHAIWVDEAEEDHIAHTAGRVTVRYMVRRPKVNKPLLVRFQCPLCRAEHVFDAHELGTPHERAGRSYTHITECHVSQKTVYFRLANEDREDVKKDN